MPFIPTPWTDFSPCCQLLDLLKETEWLEEGKVLPTHDQRGIDRDTRSITFDKECWLIDGQEIKRSE